MNIPILKYVDVIIGLSVVMMIVATVALSISQALLSMCASRARHLATGLEPLIRQLHPTLLGPHAQQIAEQVLLHPMVCQPRNPLNRYVFDPIRRLLRIPGPMPTTGSRGPGGVILREELAFCLLEWAAGEWGWQDPASPATAKASAVSANAVATSVAGLERQKALAEALKQRGIEDPAATLRAVRLQAMENEKAHPEQSAQLWRSQALAQVAPSEFVASLYQSFDTAMARATASFGTEAQIWVSAVAVVLVVIIQLDTFALVRRLSVDDTYRQTLVEEAKRLDAISPSKSSTAPAPVPMPTPPDGAPVPPPPTRPSQPREKPSDIATAPNTTSGDSCKNAPTDLEFQKCEINRSLNLLHSPTLDIWPDKKFDPARIPGILVTWLLVSLGAPFWYDLLKNLFQMRSVLADRDQRERAERATPAPSMAVETKPADARPNGSTASTASVTAPDHRAANDDGDLGGESGDLSATGAQG